MDQLLGRINALDGVLGSFVCDKYGNVITNAVPANLAIAAMKAINRQVTQALAARRENGIQTIDLIYNGMRVLIRDLGQAALTVICETDVDIALLRMTLNVEFARPEIETQLNNITMPKDTSQTVLRVVSKDEMDEISWKLYGTINEGVI